MLMEKDFTSATVAEIALSGERRRCGRLYEPYPVRMRGVARAGGAFLIETKLDNISSGGFYLRTPVEVDQERLVRAVVTFKTSMNEGRTAPRLWIRGRVLRSERQADGRFGVAVQVKGYRFL